MNTAQSQTRSLIEQLVLACCMSNEDGLVADYCIDEGLTSKFFYEPKHGEIWATIEALRSNSKAVSSSDVLINNRSEGLVDALLLNDIENRIDSGYWGFFKDYVSKLKSAHKIDCVREASRRFDHDIKEGMDVDDAVQQLDASLKDLDSFGDLKLVSDYVYECHKELATKSPESRGLYTGFAKLDNFIQLKNEHIIILAARQSKGKTSLGLDIASNVAVDQKKNVVMFSMEMTTKELIKRLISSRSEVSQDRIGSKQTDFESEARIKKALEALHSSRFWIDDRKARTVAQIASRARSLKNKFGLDLGIIDYLSLIRIVRPSGSRREDVDAVSRELKLLAGETGIPWIVLAQLSREHVKKGRDPRPDDLREAGGIEQDADEILLLHHKSANDLENPILIIAKNKDGPIGEIDLIFKPFWTKFLDAKEEEASNG